MRAPGGRLIRRRTRCTCSSSIILRNGDCSSWIASPWRSVPSNTGSPVLLSKSARTIVSLSVSLRRAMEIEICRCGEQRQHRRGGGKHARPAASAGGDASQFPLQLGGGLPPASRVLFQTPAYDSFQLSRPECASLRRRLARRSTFRRARSRMNRCPSGHRPVCLPAAPAPCRRACPSPCGWR